METINEWLFLTAAAFLFNHELDAIKQGEWRFFFGRLPMNDEKGYQWFTAVHLPLFVFILRNLSSVDFQVGLDIFLVAHALVHWALRNHPLVHFNQPFSRLWIFGGGLLGIIHLVMLQFSG